MTLFWILCACLSVAVVAILLLALMRGARDTGPAEAFDLQVYRDQLREIDRDVARGVTGGDEAERLRTEISRRILSADSKAQTTIARVGAERGKWAVAAVMVVAVLGGGFGLYLQLGAPGYPDLPLKARIEAAKITRDTRPSQAEAQAQLPAALPSEASPEYAELVKQLRSTLAERPNDLQGLQLLARSEAALGNFKAAWAAQARVIEVRGNAATSRDYADLADMMVLAAGGYVSPEAQVALEASMSRDPGNGVARYYGGLMMAQTGRPDLAFRMWDRLMRESPPDAPWMPPILQQIEEMAYRAGVVDYQIPSRPSAPGPTADDIEAAQDMTPEERMEMIRGMVAGLSDRLATDGGPPEDWARLINALAVLGETDQASAIVTEARTVFAETPQALAQINAAAARAGIGP